MIDFRETLLYRLWFFIVALLIAGNLALLALHMANASATDTGTTTGPFVSLSSKQIKSGSRLAAVTGGFKHGADATGRAFGDGAHSVATALVHSATWTGHTVMHGAVLIGHGTLFVLRIPGKVAGFIVHPSRWGSIITPVDHTPVPTITQLRAQQAAIIESGTKDVSILAAGSGGACDNGQGNGGYPLAWCNAPLDSLRTVTYSGDPINRECTSYAYWYFTNVEGHLDFRATGNAKYWAETSNYPVHATPAIGAIAVETRGAYGHVAIVQALPGQQYDGQAVPAGYVLVSEMNYDWGGHFRYSFSPLGKFSAYIY